MPLSSANAGAWGEEEGRMRLLFDGHFHEGSVQTYPCAQNITIWNVWAVCHMVLFVYPNYSTTHAPSESQDLFECIVAYLWSLYFLLLVKNLRELRIYKHIGSEGCLSVGFGDLARDFYLLDLPWANTCFAV